MAWRIQFRHDSATNWSTANPTMMQGEMGLELDTGKFKVGNGTQSWNDLPYSSGPAGPAGADGAQGPQGDPTTVNGHTGATITLDAADVGAVPSAALGADNGVAELDANGRLVQAQRPIVTIGAYATTEDLPTTGIEYGDWAQVTTPPSYWIWLNAGGTDGWHARIYDWSSELNQPDGIASLDANGNLPQSQRPDVIFHGDTVGIPTGAQFGDVFNDTTAGFGNSILLLGGPDSGAAGEPVSVPIDSWLGALGQPDGIATLDSEGKVSSSQLPTLDYIPTSEKAAVNGVASLGSDGKVPNSQLPPLAITDTFVVTSQAAMLALSAAEVGDVAVRSDISRSFILHATPASTLSNWQELLTPPNAVLSVDGRTGSVTLSDRYDVSGAASAALVTAEGYTDTAIAAEVIRADGAYLPSSTPKVLPAGGTTGQVLAKTSSTDYAVGWSDTTTASQVQQYVKNNTGTTLLKGQAVYVSGATGTNVLVSLARANAESTSSNTLGLLLQDLTTGSQGYVLTNGKLTGINTGGLTEGDPVFLSPTTAGGLVYGLANKPSAPNHLVYIGTVTRAHAIQGELFVKVQNGYELEELHNVSANSPSNNDLLRYNSTTSLWENAALINQPNGIAGLNANGHYPAGSLAQSTMMAVLGQPQLTGAETVQAIRGDSGVAVADGDVLRRNGSAIAFGKVLPASLSSTGASTGDALVYNGTAWAPGTPGGPYGFTTNVVSLAQSVISTQAMSPTTSWFSRVYYGGTVSKIGFYSGSATPSGTVSVGIYSSTGTGRNAAPNTLLVSGTVTVTSGNFATGTYLEVTLSAPLTLTPGNYWFGITGSNASTSLQAITVPFATVPAMRTGVVYSMTNSVASTLPTTVTAPVTSGITIGYPILFGTN
jgi:Major tropism determinant N-terminal domain